MAGCGGGCVEVPLKRFLEHGLQCDPCLACQEEAIPFLEWPGVKTGGEEKPYCIRDKLGVCARVAAKEGCLSTFWYTMEEELLCIGSQVWAAKHCVFCIEYGPSGLVVDVDSA